MEKSYRDLLVTARGDLLKNPVGWKHGYKSQNRKKVFKLLLSTFQSKIPSMLSHTSWGDTKLLETRRRESNSGRWLRSAIATFALCSIPHLVFLTSVSVFSRHPKINKLLDSPPCVLPNFKVSIRPILLIYFWKAIFVPSHQRRLHEMANFFHPFYSKMAISAFLGPSLILLASSFWIANLKLEAIAKKTLWEKLSLNFCRK